MYVWRCLVNELKITPTSVSSKVARFRSDLGKLVSIQNIQKMYLQRERFTGERDGPGPIWTSQSGSSRSQSANKIGCWLDNTSVWPTRSCKLVPQSDKKTTLFSTRLLDIINPACSCGKKTQQKNIDPYFSYSKNKCICLHSVCQLFFRLSHVVSCLHSHLWRTDYCVSCSNCKTV